MCKSKVEGSAPAGSGRGERRDRFSISIASGEKKEQGKIQEATSDDFPLLICS